MAASQVLMLTRGLSTSSAVCGKLVRTPIAVFGTDGRYAAALYSAASKEKNLDTVEKEITSLKGYMAKDKKFSEFILNPSLKKQLKRDALLAALKKKQFSKTTLNFCETLADNGRLNKLNAIISTFGRVMSAHRGEVVCEVVTAKPLDEALKTELNAALKGFVKSGQTITLTMKVLMLKGYMCSGMDAGIEIKAAAILFPVMPDSFPLLGLRVDPTIVGGMLVSIGDRYADMSLANKIKNYTNLLKQAV